MTRPYTYLIKHKSGKLYFGVRYAKGCTPEDLWTTYFTSSKHVQNLINIDGIESFIVLNIFEHDSKDDARTFETKVLNYFVAHRNQKFINKSCGGIKFWCPDEITNEVRERRRLAKLGTKASLETRRKMSATRTGLYHTEQAKKGMRKPKSAEHAQNIKKAKQGPLFSKLDEVRKIWEDNDKPSYRKLAKILSVDPSAVRKMYYQNFME